MGTTASDSGQSHERWELQRHRDEADAVFKDTTKLDDELLSVCCMRVWDSSGRSR